MPQLQADTTIDDVLANVLDTLAEATVDGQPLFVEVKVYEDLSAFQAVANAAAGMVAGIIAGQPQRALSDDNGEDHKSRLPIDIAVRLMSQRGAGDANTAAMIEMAKVAELVRQALNLDRRRGGLADAMMWNGAFVDGTDTKGDARLIQPKASQAFFTALIPAACTWSVDEANP